MTTKTEGRHDGEFMVSEANGHRSRETGTVTVPANTTLPPGSVLGQITATSKYVQYDNAETDGREDAAAILYAEQINDTGAPVDVEAAVVVRDAEVRLADLEFESGQDQTAQDAAIVDLAALGVIAR